MKEVVIKIIYYFCQCTDILKTLVILVIFQNGKLWKSKGLSDEVIKPPTPSDNSLAPASSYIGNKTRVIFYGSCLRRDKVTFTHGENSKYIHCL